MKARIIAANPTEALQLAREEGLPEGSFKVVSGKADLHGFRGVVMIGPMAGERPDFNDLREIWEANNCSVIFT